jgi:hypothetical protein
MNPLEKKNAPFSRGVFPVVLSPKEKGSVWCGGSEDLYPLTLYSHNMVLDCGSSPKGFNSSAQGNRPGNSPHPNTVLDPERARLPGLNRSRKFWRICQHQTAGTVPRASMPLQSCLRRALRVGLNQGLLVKPFATPPLPSSALSGRQWLFGRVPRALPWAVESGRLWRDGLLVLTDVSATIISRQKYPMKSPG